MVLPQQNFGCHIAWRATSVSAIILKADSGKSKIDKGQVTMFIENNIFRPDISMDHSVTMHKFQS